MKNEKNVTENCGNFLSVNMTYRDKLSSYAAGELNWCWKTIMRELMLDIYNFSERKSVEKVLLGGKQRRRKWQ
jgi:hypothetical protein